MVFLVGWLPFAIMLMLPTVHAPVWVNLLTVVLAHGSTFANPLLYFTTNDLLRKAFMKFFTRIFDIQTDRSSSNEQRSVRRKTTAL